MRFGLVIWGFRLKRFPTVVLFCAAILDNVEPNGIVMLLTAVVPPVEGALGFVVEAVETLLAVVPPVEGALGLVVVAADTLLAVAPAETVLEETEWLVPDICAMGKPMFP
jgi:hypothetical protein